MMDNDVALFLLFNYLLFVNYLLFAYKFLFFILEKLLVKVVIT
jgi:hypothetical protein